MAVGNPLTPGGFIALAQEAGLSATTALNEARAAGVEIRTQTWYRLWGEVENAIAGIDRISGLDPTLLPSADAFADWSVGRPGQTLYQVDVITRDIESGGITFRPWSVVSDRILTPLEAMQQAEDELSDNADAYGEAIMGSMMRQMYRLGGRP